MIKIYLNQLYAPNLIQTFSEVGIFKLLKISCVGQLSLFSILNGIEIFHSKLWRMFLFSLESNTKFSEYTVIE